VCSSDLLLNGELDLSHVFSNAYLPQAD